MFSERDWKCFIGCLVVIGVLIGAVAVVATQKACATYRVRVEKVK